MGKVGGCCCVAPVCCIALAELPTLEAHGTTVNPAVPGDWVLTKSCCWVSKFIPIPSGGWQRLGPDTTIMDDRQAEVDYLVYVRDSELQSFPGPVDPQHPIDCCSNPLRLCNTVHESNQWRTEQFFMAQQQTKGIRVYLFRKNVSIGGAPAVCKTFVVSVNTTQYQVRQVGTGGGRHFYTGGVGGCCGATGMIDKTVTAPTIEQLWDELTRTYAYEMEIYSAQMLDAIPSGVVNFTPGQTVDNISFGGGVPCVPLDWAEVGIELNSADAGVNPVWFTPYVTTTMDTFRATCNVGMIFPDVPEPNCHANQIHCDPSTEIQAINTPNGGEVSYKTLLQGFVFNYQGAVPVNVDWGCYSDCFGPYGNTRYLSARVLRHEIANVGSVRTFQDYIPRQFVITPGPWAVTFA